MNLGVKNLTLFIDRSDYYKVTDILDLIKDVGFENIIYRWDSIVISLDTKQVVMGYASKYSFMDIFVNEDYFKNHDDFLIIEEDDINLSQKYKYYCYDKNNKLIFSKINYRPNYEINWKIISEFNNNKIKSFERNSKILNFLKEIKNDIEPNENESNK